MDSEEVDYAVGVWFYEQSYHDNESFFHSENFLPWVCILITY